MSQVSLYKGSNIVTARCSIARKQAFLCNEAAHCPTLCAILHSLDFADHCVMLTRVSTSVLQLPLYETTNLESRSLVLLLDLRASS